MKGRHVDIGRLGEELAGAVDDRMRGFVRNDVVGEAGEYCLPRQIASRLSAAGAEIAEQNGVRLGTIEGIRLTHGVRVNIETARGIPGRRRQHAASVGPSPGNAPAERVLETLQRLAGDRVDHLLVEARI